MKPGEWFDALRKIDISDLDTNNIGAWPAPIKWLAGVLPVSYTHLTLPTILLV